MIVSLYAATLCVLYIGLSVHVVRGRVMYKIGIGDNGHEDMRRRMRAHANFAEYTPLFLIMLWFAETGGLPAYAVHLLGLIFIVGRTLHAYSVLIEEAFDNGRMVKGGNKRIAGMLCTFTTLGVLIIALLLQYFSL